MTKYRINKGISKLTVANSRVSNECLFKAYMTARRVTQSHFSVARNGEYLESDGIIWDAIEPEKRREIVRAFVNTFEQEARLTQSVIQWGA